MKHYFFSFLLMILVLSAACDFPGIFSNGGTVETESEQTAAGDTVLSVFISGGIAGVNQALVIKADGNASFVDGFRPGQRWELELDTPAMANINLLMANNHFFRLGDEYIHPNLADGFLYKITYSHEGQRKTLITNNLAVPLDLAAIVSGLTDLINQVQNDSPGLTLLLNKDTMRKGDKVEMTLQVKNFSSVPLTLNFIDGQIFDFQVRRHTNESVAEELVWNWAHGKGFTDALWSMTLSAGESKSYQIFWDGVDNAGDAVFGTFAIRANLVSRPGGTVQLMNFIITE